MRKNLLVLVAQKRDSIDLLRFKLPIVLLIASTFIISFLATSSSMIDKRYKLNLAAGLISIISQVSHIINHLACYTTKSMYLYTVGFRS